MPVFRKALWPLIKKANRGFRGYPVATVACYGPDDRRASKMVLSVVPAEGAEGDVVDRWFSDQGDVRDDPGIAAALLKALDQLAPPSVAFDDLIIGCPHEEGIDYPTGETCPQCPFWANRDRWTGDVIH